MIRATFDSNCIIVYQAYNTIIANSAIANGTFDKGYNFDRMTWIKTSFLWMMYRSDWAQKINQERILQITMCRQGFDYIINNAVPTKYDSTIFPTHDAWKNELKHSEIRVQWDPDRDIFGNDNGRRAVQLGIKGDILHKFVNEWINNIDDITDYVTELKIKRDNGISIQHLLPIETEYVINL